MKIYILIVMLACAYAADKKVESSTKATEEQSKDKRQTQGEVVIAAPAHLVYRIPRRQKEKVAPVEEPQDDDKPSASNRGIITEDYRPGQVFSLNPQELLEIQPQRKAPVSNTQHLQQLYNDPPEHKQNLQQFYILEPQQARQVAYHPSHAVIARPSYSSNGGEASVGAALSVSDGDSSSSFDQELLALLGHSPSRDEPRVPAYTPVPQVTSQSSAPQYSQVERYITKPTKKATKLRTKTQVLPPQAPTAPQQYLIETTNVQQQQQSQPRPVQQPRPAQALRYVPIPAAQPTYYPVPENQGIKIVPAPKLQQPRGQLAYRLIPQYQQQEASPKQYRILETQRQQPVRQELQRAPATTIDRPVAYLRRYPEIEKTRAVRLFDQNAPENSAQIPQSAQLVGDHYYIRPIYRTTDQRGRYQLAQLAVGSMDQSRALESTKSPHSAIYVSKNVIPKKVSPSLVRGEQSLKDQTRGEQDSRHEQPVDIEINGQSLDEQRSHLPPPRNNKAYTPEEFAALVAAGYSVTPIPVSSYRNSAPSHYAQSRSSVEQSAAPTQRRILYSRRHHYLPLRGDDAP